MPISWIKNDQNLGEEWPEIDSESPWERGSIPGRFDLNSRVFQVEFQGDLRKVGKGVAFFARIWYNMCLFKFQKKTKKRLEKRSK